MLKGANLKGGGAPAPPIDQPPMLIKIIKQKVGFSAPSLSYNSHSCSVPEIFPASSFDHTLECPSLSLSPSPRSLVALYPVSPCQLLQSDTGVPHFALDLLIHRSSPEPLSRCRLYWTMPPCHTHICNGVYVMFVKFLHKLGELAIGCSLLQSHSDIRGRCHVISSRHAGYLMSHRYCSVLKTKFWLFSSKKLNSYATQKRWGKWAGTLVKICQRGFRTPLPSIHLANLRSLPNKRTNSFCSPG